MRYVFRYFSQKIDISKFGLIYAGAQKNLGPAGATLVIVKDEILGHTGRQIPTMLDYKTHIAKDSMFNTPPVFSIYVSMLTMRWPKRKWWCQLDRKSKSAKSRFTLPNY